MRNKARIPIRKIAASAPHGRRLPLQPLLLLACLLFLPVTGPAVGSQIRNSGQIVDKVVQASGEDLEKLNRIILEHEGLLQKYPDNDFTPTVLLQLAQLYQRHSAALFQQQMEQYEKQLEAFEKNEILDEPEIPRHAF